MENLSWNYEYDEMGFIKKVIDPGGKTSEFAYEFSDIENKMVNRLMQTTSDGKIDYHFNKKGQLMLMNDNIGLVEYNFEKSGFLRTVKRRDMPSITYTYNSEGKISSIALTIDYGIEYIYDFLGRLTIMKTPAGEIKYSYDTGNNFTIRQLPNGIKTQYKYFPDGRLESIIHLDKANYLIMKYSYEYNPDGLISSIVEWTRNGEHRLEYEYDQVQRLISFINKEGRKTKFKYDNFGNRTEVTIDGKVSESYVYDGFGRMVMANDQPCQYDQSGNLVSFRRGTEEFSYNSSNQLARVNDLEFEYDGNGSLITRNNSDHKTRFLTNPLSEIWQPLLSISDDNQYTFYIWEGNNPIARIENGEKTFFLMDHLNSVRGITDKDGNLVRLINYSPFGIPDQELSANGFEPGFTGLFYEPQAGIYLTRARAYDPNSGRFLQIDPLHQVPSGSQKDLSVYAYCGLDPINFVDLDGLKSNFIDGIINGFKNFLSQHLYNSTEGWNEFFSHYLYGKGELDFWPKVNYNIKNDFNYFFNTSVRDNVIDEILNNAIRISSNRRNANNFILSKYSTIELANSLIIKWRANPEKYKIDNLMSTTPNSSELQVASHIMLVREQPISGLFTVAWGIVHYFGERSYGIIRPSHFTGIKTERTWERETWKAIIYPFLETFKLENLKTILKNIDNFISKPAYGDEINLSEIDLVYSSHSPCNVGGVSLASAGKTFEGLGQLNGIAIDKANGKLVLISKDKGQIDLPPLRIDDVVTVFRSVYQQGEAPFVSIDPDPQNPRGPIMISRHGEATKNTFVGWILFEADRIMKGYSLGEDNITHKPVQTKIKGYEKVLEAMFATENKKETWERFWIVPAKVEKNISSKDEVILYEVPLMVKTQKMILHNGKLEPDPNGKISKGAQKFAEWFTDNYDKLAEEAYSLPPEGSGFDKPVPVFQELKRIALITAIAEHLRDQGVPFPFWMRGYQSSTFSTPETTPAHTVRKNKGQSLISVYGGVNLSPSDDNVYSRKNSAEANHISQKIAEKIKNIPYVKTVSVNGDHEKYQISAIPGTNTKDLNPCILKKTDISVRINGDRYLSLTRKFNSFVKPLDKVFGNAWSLDLPYLEKQKVPLRRSGDDTEFTYAYQMISPLNSIAQRIDKLYVGDNKQIGFKTKLVIQNNVKLHFNDDGFLVAYEEKPFTLVYNRDNNNRIRQIAGIFGDLVLADIKLEYDKNNRIVSARGSNGETAEYHYSSDGMLVRVKKGKETFSYEYQDELVAGINMNDLPLKQFTYSLNGQLVSEIDIDNLEITSSIETLEDGYQLTRAVKSNGQPGKGNYPKEVIRYNFSYKPVKHIFADGTLINADYTSTDQTKLEVSDPADNKLVVTVSKDQKSVSYELPDGIKYQEEYDENDQLLSIGQDGQVMVRNKWTADGLLTETACESYSIHFEYSPDGVLQRTLITPSGNQSSWSEWKSYEYDKLGRLSAVSDYRGMKKQLGYDNSGNLHFIGSNNGNIKIEYQNNLIRQMEASWGLKAEYSYDNDGNLEEIIYIKNGSTAKIHFEKVMIREIKNYDGSYYSYAYSSQENKEHLIAKINTPINEIEYRYDNERLALVICDNKYQVGYRYDEAGRIKQLKIMAE